MLASSPEQLLQMSDGAVPEAITGVLTNLQANPITGGEGDKAYKFQNATLTQDGSSIRIVFSNRDDVPQDLVGQQIVAKCKKNDKGLYGLKRKTGREYQGKTPPEIWVYAGAELSVNQGFVDNGTPDSPTPKTTESTASLDPVSRAKKSFVQMANTMSICYDTALWVAETQEKKNDYVMTEAQIQAIASSCFIKADRSGIIEKMPQTPIS